MDEQKSNRDNHEEFSHLHTMEVVSDDDSVSSMESSKDVVCDSETELCSTDIATGSAPALTVYICGTRNKVYSGCNVIQEVNNDDTERRIPYLSLEATNIAGEKWNRSLQTQVIPERSSEVPPKCAVQLPSRDNLCNGPPETESTADAQFKMEQLSKKLGEAYSQAKNIESSLTKIQEENNQLKKEIVLLKRQNLALNNILKNTLDQSEKQENMYSVNVKGVRWPLVLLSEMAPEQGNIIRCICLSVLQLLMLWECVGR